MAECWRAPTLPARGCHDRRSGASRNAESISFFDRGSLFAALIAIDDGEHLAATWRRVAAHIIVVDLHHDRPVLRHVAQDLRHVVGTIVQAINRADNLQISITSAGITWIARVPRIAGVPVKDAPAT